MLDKLDQRSGAAVLCGGVRELEFLFVGTLFFPTLEDPVELELLEARTFASGATYLRYSAIRPCRTTLRNADAPTRRG